MEYSNYPTCVIILVALLMIVLNEAMPYEDKRKPLQPSFKPTPTNITVHKGELVVLKCHIEDVGPRVVVWRRLDNDVPLTIGESRFSQEENIAIEVEKISEKESHWDLIIKDVQLEHAGTYLCQVVASKLYTYYITLTVLDEPMRSGPGLKLLDVHIDGSIYVDKGGQIRLKCNATGASRAPDGIEWYFKGERIVESIAPWKDRTRILRHQRKNARSSISELIVDNASLEDGGNYVCRSSDLKMSFIHVHVLESVGKNSYKRDQSIKDAEQSSDLRSTASAAGRFTWPPVVVLSFLTICYVTVCTERDIRLIFLVNMFGFITTLKFTST